MRSAIDTRHQPGGVKAPGKAGSRELVAGAGIEHPQNRVAAGAAGTGSRSGAKGGPSEHPQNHLPLVEGSAAEEATETPAFEAREDGTVAGPSATGAATAAIPAAGTGGDGKPGAKGGAQHGHPQNKVLPVKVKRTTAAPARKASKGGGYLHTLSKV